MVLADPCLPFAAQGKRIEVNWVESLVEFITRFWPFAIIDQYEEGVLYVLGRAKKERLMPGLYMFVPWFMDVVAVVVVPDPVSSPLLNVTLTDDTALTYSVTAIYRITIPWCALNMLNMYKRSIIEMISSKTSEMLGEVNAARVIDPAKRKTLLTTMLVKVTAEMETFGITVDALRFTNFILKQRTYRVITDASLPLPDSLESD